ncbi:MULTISPECIES: hypothetical protein [Rhodococcus]|uniref:Uncharacterized protein n=1 Tax=Rhodococcus indonesiensis TaxID=3055869 RepID=A0ABT7RPR1_9NOCA|nr:MULTISPECIES: hypothetical protein [Rhodococcus]MDM7489624.1 hypothetical protein [Rhodococcus indonesiensis]
MIRPAARCERQAESSVRGRVPAGSAPLAIAGRVLGELRTTSPVRVVDPAGIVAAMGV